MAASHRVTYFICTSVSQHSPGDDNSCYTNMLFWILSRLILVSHLKSWFLHNELPITLSCYSLLGTGGWSRISPLVHQRVWPFMITVHWKQVSRGTPPNRVRLGLSQPVGCSAMVCLCPISMAHILWKILLFMRLNYYPAADQAILKFSRHCSDCGAVCL